MYGNALDTVHSHVCVGVLVLICVIVPDFTFVLVLFAITKVFIAHDFNLYLYVI